jgi:hypothetical protein
MSDGNYYVKAWIDYLKCSDVNFSDIKIKEDNHFKGLGTLSGISTLDEIKIQVVGSKSDDINFSERN